MRNVWGNVHAELIPHYLWLGVHNQELLETCRRAHLPVAAILFTLTRVLLFIFIYMFIVSCGVPDLNQFLLLVPAKDKVIVILSEYRGLSFRK